MKITASNFISLFPRQGVLAALSLLGLAFAPNLHADSGDQEHLEFKAALLPTADAPAGASGKAELNADDKHGTTKATLKIEAKGLAPAIYTVNVALKSDTTTVTLGSLVVTGSAVVSGSTVVSGTGSDDSDSNETHGGRGDAEEGRDASVVFGGKKGLPFPDGFDPFDIGAISVVDPNVVVMLNGDLTSGTTQQRIMRKEVVSVVPGVAAPNAQGKLNITAVSKNGVEKAVISLFARKVPANLSFNVDVNGTQVGQGVSSKRGEIRLGQTPGKHKGFAGFGQDVSGLNLQSVILTTGTGDVILSATP